MSLGKPISLQKRLTPIAVTFQNIHSMSRKGREKLKLKNSMDSDNSLPPPNQEALLQDDDDSDFEDFNTITDVNVNNGLAPLDIALEAVNKIDKLSRERLYIAKAREGLVYGKSSKNFPPFCHFNLRCNPDLGNSETTLVYKSMMDAVIEETKNGFYERSISVLDNLLDDRKSEIKRIKKDAKKRIGTDVKGAEAAKNTLSEKLSEIKTRMSKELADFQTEIRYKPSTTHGDKRKEPEQSYNTYNYRGSKYLKY